MTYTPLAWRSFAASCFGNSTYVPWQEDGLERRCEVDVGPENDCQKEFRPEDGSPEEVRGPRMAIGNNVYLDANLIEHSTPYIPPPIWWRASAGQLIFIWHSAK